MFKNKTEQNRNDEKYNQTGITVKIHTNHNGVKANMIMLKSIAACSSWRSLVITTVIPVIPSDLHVLVNSAVIHSKKHSPCTVCFLPCCMKKLACFYELFFLFFCFLFSWSSLNISLQDSILETETSGKSVKFNLPNYLVCKLSQIVNFDGFLTLMVWHFWQFLSCTANQITWTILTGILIGLL